MALIGSWGEKRDQVAWTITSYQAFHIFYLIKRSTEKFLQGDLSGWYFVLNALREQLNCDLNPEEIVELDDYEHKISKLNYRINGLMQEDDFEENKKKQREVSALKMEFTRQTKLYQRRIMKLTKEVGYLPNKEDRTKLSF